jgi:hypothetical protein
VSLARALLKPQSETETETAFSGDERRLERFHDWGSNYESRMQFETPLVMRGHLPAFVRDLIYESQDCFRWGLPKAAIASCRMAIDGLVVEVAKAQFMKLSETTRRRVRGRQRNSFPTVMALASENTDVLINDLPDKYLNQSEKNNTKSLRDDCNKVIHGRSREGPQTIGPLDKGAWRILSRTIGFISLLIERGSLIT